MNVAKFFDFSKLTRRGSGGTSRSQFYYDSTEVSPVAAECDTRYTKPMEMCRGILDVLI